MAELPKKNQRNQIDFVYLAGVEPKSVRRTGRVLTGTWGGKARALTRAKLWGAVEAFMNSGDNPVGSGFVESFVGKYAPLTASFRANAPFTEDLSEWVEKRDELLYLWGSRSNLWSRKSPYAELIDRIRIHDLHEGDHLYLTGVEPVVSFASLWSAMHAFVATTPGQLLKKCANVDCHWTQRYFIANHHSRLYCSRDCSNKAIRRSKRETWHKHENRYRPPK